MPLFKKKRKKQEEEKINLSQDYIEFLIAEKKAREPKSWYEKLCRSFGKIGLKAPKSIRQKLEEDTIFSMLNVSPDDVFSATIVTLLFFGGIAIALSFLTTGTGKMIFLFSVPLATAYYIYSYPNFKAQVLKVQTGDESIKIILYIVIYLKLHPNFEGAINFAASHVKGPISTDMKKAMWDLNTGKYKNIEEALSAYMPKWGVWNEDFIRSLSLLYGVLIEPTEQGRERILKKSLSFLLVNTQRKMKNYVEGISGPITILHTMGMLLPVIGLIMFPIVSMFLHDTVNSFYVGIGYVVFLPLIIYFLMNRILLKRPSAFMVPDVSNIPGIAPPGKVDLDFFKMKFRIPIFPFVMIIGILVMSYGILHFIDLASELNDANRPTKELILREEADVRVDNMLSTFSISMGFGLIIYLYFYLESYKRIEVRNEIKNIESEFQIGLFSLGNYLSEGYPLETAIQKSLDEYEKLGMEKRPTYSFFSKLLYNIKNFGFTFERALFDKKQGILVHFPSVLIEEIMKTLSDASQRSSVLLGNISKTIGGYLEDLNTIEDKIRELLEEVRGGIRIQASFVVPLICGITGALGLFILNMLRLLSCQVQQIERAMGLGMGTTTGMGDLMNQLLGDFTKVMPMTVLQTIIGVYTFEIVTLLALLLNGIENGFDRTSRNNMIAKMVLNAIIIYGVTSLISVVLFNSIIVDILRESMGGALGCE